MVFTMDEKMYSLIRCGRSSSLVKSLSCKSAKFELLCLINWRLGTQAAFPGTTRSLHRVFADKLQMLTTQKLPYGLRLEHID